MTTIKQEIQRITADFPVQLLEIDGENKEQLINNIKDTFVRGNPRALWLGFKYIPDSIKYEFDYPYLKIPELVDSNEILYFLIDDFNTNYYLLKGLINDIFFFIEECEGLDEYYIVSEDIKRIICETDHDELLLIDVQKNKERI